MLTDRRPKDRYSWEVYLVSFPPGVFKDSPNVGWLDRSRNLRPEIVDKSRESWIMIAFSWCMYCALNALIMIGIGIPFRSFYSYGVSGFIFRVALYTSLAGLVLSTLRYALPAGRHVYLSHIWDAAILALGITISWLNPLSN